MIIDSRNLPEGTKIESDICIIGAGAAGISLAREFKNTQYRVCLLESGGLDYDPDNQALYKGENVGFPYYPLDALRLRYFGGTTNHWAGACRPLDEIDFTKRSWVPDSGWPFDKSHLDPFYERAHSVIQLGPYDYSLDSWVSKKKPKLPFNENLLTTAMFRGHPLRFGQVYHDEIKNASNIHTYLFANVTNIASNSDGNSIDKLQVATLTGNKFTVSSKIIILATGGIENPRILLASNDVQKNGLGNQFDLVGRYFMEHVSAPAAVLFPSDSNFPMDLYAGKKDKQGKAIGYSYLTLPEKVIKDEELLNIRAFILKIPNQDALTSVSEGVASADAILETMREAKLANDFDNHLVNALKDFNDVAIYSYQKFFRPELRKKSAYYLNYHIEQAPNPESRVTLTTERDKLGMQRPQLAWHFGELEKRTLKRTNDIIAQELGRTGIGHLRLTRTDPDTGWPSVLKGVRGAWHQMGTTRMHADPKQGVVDENCRVHGISNLYVAGSSVFPSSGYTNPTLTIVALSIRLADQIKRELG